MNTRGDRRWEHPEAKEEALQALPKLLRPHALSAAEEIPWNCRRLVVGTGAHGALPIMEDIEREAQARHVELVMAPTPEAIEELVRESQGTNAILHVTC